MTIEEQFIQASKEYRKYRESCGLLDPVALDEIEDVYYQGMKEQMMKDSFDATVCKVGGVTFLKEMDKGDIVKALESYSDGDKVKVIIIKEEYE